MQMVDWQTFNFALLAFQTFTVGIHVRMVVLAHRMIVGSDVNVNMAGPGIDATVSNLS